jgi:hypothetical protein
MIHFTRSSLNERPSYLVEVLAIHADLIVLK